MKPERYKEIEELYHAALGHKPEERAAFIEQACTSDEGLRREVESLLGYNDRAAEFIETPPERGADVPCDNFVTIFQRIRRKSAVVLAMAGGYNL